MTDNTEQGYAVTDVTAIASTILGITAIVLMLTLPYREVGFGIAAAIAGLILAITTGIAARRNGRGIPIAARVGSLASAAAIILLIVWEFTR